MLMSWRRVAWVAGAVVAIATLFFTGACGSNLMPPPISENDRQRIAKAHLPLTVGVEVFSAPVYSQRLVRQLRATKLFDRVDDLSKFPVPPDLIARVERPIHGEAAIPVRTFVTAGILSTTIPEEHGESFSMRSGKCQDMTVPVAFTYSGEATIGWWAVVLNLGPNYSKRDPESHPNYRDNLALRIVREADAFLAMKRQGC